MANQLRSLWPVEALNSSVQSPVSILRAQGTMLAQGTNGLLVGQVHATKGHETQITFDIVAPSLRNYRHQLLTVEHSINAVFPATIKSDAWPRSTSSLPPSLGDVFSKSEKEAFEKHANDIPSKTAFSESEFIVFLEEIFSARSTVAVLQTLMAQSNEEGESEGPNDSVSPSVPIIDPTQIDTTYATVAVLHAGNTSVPLETESREQANQKSLQQKKTSSQVSEASPTGGGGSTAGWFKGNSGKE